MTLKSHEKRAHSPDSYRDWLEHLTLVPIVIRTIDRGCVQNKLMAVCYILYSPRLDTYYIGSTSESIESRLKKHLSKFYGTNHFTGTTNDWEIYYNIQCSSSKQARKIENHIKRMKSKQYIQNLMKYPEITNKLLSKYK